MVFIDKDSMIIGTLYIYIHFTIKKSISILQIQIIKNY